MNPQELASRKNLYALALAAATIQIAAYWLSGALVNGPGPLAAPQPDTLLYCQSARRVAEGCAFSFSEGSAVCTGSTTVLHPFLLAIPVWLGFTGDALVSAGFWMNALFYLIFAAAWTSVVLKEFSAAPVRLLATALIVLCGSTAYCTFAQSDIGLWLAASGLLAAGFAHGKPAVFAPVLAIAPWIRPEGMVCAIAFSLVAAVRRNRRDLAIAALALASGAGVFVLNWALTGHVQFASVANKGYFTNFGLAEGAYRTAADLLDILKSFLFSIPNGAPRDFFSIPLLGGLLLWFGATVHDWKRPNAPYLAVYLLAVGGGVLTVAQSGWQNTNMDRYLAWVFPPLLCLSAEGAAALAERLASRAGKTLAFALPALQAFGGACALVAVFHLNSRSVAAIQAYGRACDAAILQHTSVGGTGGCGLAFELSPRRMAHLSGIYSPEFQSKLGLPNAFEVLKNEPATRFDFWLLEPDDPFLESIRKTTARQVLVGPLGREVRMADWKTFSRAAETPSELAANRTLKARVDVGYEKDERKADYEIGMDYALRPFRPFVHVGDSAKGQLVETGRLVAGFDAMTVALEPGKDARVVMRVLPEFTVTANEPFVRARTKYAISNPASLHVEVDGEEACHASYSFATNGFTDVSFDIPGRAIRKTPARIAFHGDHLVCAYWFFQ